MSSAEKDRANWLRWDGKQRGWYEVYFLKFNDLQSQSAGWIRYTMTSPRPGEGEPRCELWGMFYDAQDPGRNLAVKQTFPIDRLSEKKNDFELIIADARLSGRACSGKIESAESGHSLEWDLQFKSSGDVLYHFPYQRMYSLPLPKTKLLCPHFNARFTGELIVDGRRIDLVDAPGQQEHMWGSQHGLRWAWGHCNSFAEDPEAVWEGLDAQVKIGPITSPHLKLFFLNAFGQSYRMNSLAGMLKNKSSWRLDGWNFEASAPGVRLLGELSLRPDDLIGVGYLDPGGEKLWCSNTKVASMKLRLFDSVGKPLGELTSSQAAAYEFVERRPHPRVPVLV